MVQFKTAQSFRDDFSYTNSPVAVRRFPFPFPQEQYRYSVNIEPHKGGAPGSVYEHWFDIDEHYLSEVRERAIVLEQDPARCHVQPHMRLAAWDTLEMLMEHFARDYPEHFTLERKGDDWRWVNRPLGMDQGFRFGVDESLPMEPFEYITRQAQGDWAMLDQRDGDLFMDGGIITGPADWSLDFDLGMSFKQWHGPVPLAHEMGLFDRALKYLCNIQVGRPARRLNWTMSINPLMDQSPENYPLWGPSRSSVTQDNVPRLVYLRVELQGLHRLPRSHALLFPIRTYLISLQDLVTQPGWGRRLRRVLMTLPPELVEYKGLTRYIGMVIDWLEPWDRDD
jgi:hypothetical protein